MSYTINIKTDNDCNYIDAQSQNAYKMLATCSSKYNKKSSNNMDVLFVNNQNLEGFTNYTDNGPGANHVKSGSCPDGFTKDKKGCRQVCTHCNYRDDEPKSRYMNPYDICEPDGYFNGIDNYGNIKCKPKENYKEDPLKYSADGTFNSNILVHFVNSKRTY